MKIDNNDFKKLKQLDRIEFMLKKKEIGNYESATLSVSWTFILILGFVFLVNLSLMNYNIEMAKEFLQGIQYIPKIMILGVIVCFILDIINLTLHLKKINKLEREYFDFKLK